MENREGQEHSKLQEASVQKYEEMNIYGNHSPTLEPCTQLIRQ